MGLLEFQAMPSLRDKAHGGWLCTFTKYNISWKFHQLAAEQLLSGQPVTVRKGQAVRQVTYKLRLPGHSPPVSQASSRVGPAL
jgi:hypothetical protein